MIFHRRTHLPSALPSFVVNENVINRVENCKFLGIMVDDRLNFKNHVEFTPVKLVRLSNYKFYTKFEVSFQPKNLYKNIIR